MVACQFFKMKVVGSNPTLGKNFSSLLFDLCLVVGRGIKPYLGNELLFDLAQ